MELSSLTSNMARPSKEKLQLPVVVPGLRSNFWDAAGRATSIASSDFARQVAEKRGAPIGNLLPKTPGQVVQQGCHKTPVDLAAVDIAAADLAAPRDLLGDG